MGPINNIAITGGAGYIGSHIAKTLYKASYRSPGSFIIDNLSTGNSSSINWLDLFRCDISRDHINLGGIDAVIHCAAVANVGESIADPLKCYDVNIGGTINLIQCMKNYGVKHIIFSSTCVIDGQHPYGRSKKMCERIIRDSGLNYSILRYYNVSGADNDADIGESHFPETHIIPLAIEAALTETPFKLHGSDHLTKDGTAVRDYVHVSDIADIHLQEIQALSDGMTSSTRNIGTGKAYSVMDIIKTVERLTKKNIAIEKHSRRGGDISRIVALPSNNYIFRSLDEIVSTSINWYKKVNKI